MKKVVMNVLLVSSLIFAASCDDNKSANNADDSKDVAKEQNDAKFDDTNIEGDTKFAVEAADCGMLEAKAGELAASMAVSSEAKELGKMMRDEHNKANAELKALAAQKNISLPETLSDKKQEKYNDLAKKTGKDFDKAFVDEMIDGHKKAIDDFKKEAKDGNDADLRSWASGKVATLEHHLDMAEGAKSALKK